MNTVAKKISGRLRHLRDLATGARESASGIVRDSTLPYPSASLFFWQESPSRINFGDFLSLIVVSNVLAMRGYTLHDEVPNPRRLLAIGSILHLARDGNVIWGSGANGRSTDKEYSRSIDVRAVRGPLTAELLRRIGVGDVPDVYGDPGLLLPIVTRGRFQATGLKDVVVVPNFADLPGLQGDPRVVSPLLAWNTCVRGILQGKLVVASSLHGLVIAEAFGIPARYVRFSEHEPLFKYQDYVQGTGRNEFEWANSIPEAIEMGGMPPPVVDTEALLKAFPYDVWGA